jgi:hypothetical protein
MSEVAGSLFEVAGLWRGVKVAVPWSSPLMSRGLSLLRMRWRIQGVFGRFREVKRVVRRAGVGGRIVVWGWIIVWLASYSLCDVVVVVRRGFEVKIEVE